MKATHQPTITLTSDPMRPSALLRGAALYLDRHGWIKGDFFDLLTDANFPPACSLGAINICAHGNPTLSASSDADDVLSDHAIRAMRVLAAYLDDGYHLDGGLNGPSAIDVVSGWNDEPGRTLAEVIETLNDAADDWEAAQPTGGAR
jgi:hypothetical protein